MIQYALKCTDGHRFDSWFKSADAFDKLLSAGMVNCAVCGTTHVSKAIMAPRVSTGGAETAQPQTPTPAPELHKQVLAELKAHIEKTSDYVGDRFVREARDMHDGLIPERPIYGEARVDEARKLFEDGVPVAPLPFVPGRKTN
ncbi:DUF1178 family protein [Mesobacterium sp. TK19101]|uniref:DUF1178 family protein n=1 Tax=Mesobacterium hydrothermale TaxID=3111907 RepID=A0ABU6HKS6_9RHOB|nr:DUF1178 family protein [Mesobacterium sp. TK19101]MEC3862043.1 DUF1178 family protein [Mesobacterium sp. TK19101]